MPGKAANEKGADLERRFARAEFAEGSLVRLRHPVTHQISNRRRVITDVDVLSLDFDARLRPQLGITECKSTRGQAGEQDRLLWLKGMQSLVGADRASLVRESVSPAGRDVARRIGVDLIGGDELARREKVLDHMPDRFATIGATAFTDQAAKAAEQLKTIGLRSGLVAFLEQDALLAEPHRVLGALLTLDEATKTGAVVPMPLASVLAGHSLQALLVAALRAGGRIDVIGVEGVRREIEQGLGTGDPHDQQLFRVAEMADTLLNQELADIHRAYRAQGATVIERQVPSLRQAIAQAPAWLPRFVDLAERLRRRTPVARQLPQTVDLVVFDALYDGDAWSASSFDHLFGREHRQLLTVALECLASALPALAGTLDPVTELPFDRVPTAALRDRTAHAAGYGVSRS
ncbi:hypothetical protein [Catenulispora subtropica]|uniref:Uncharacterized protein n=1 Tax=Catenulispora subtropica TaxID=450798 RepID=A0ABN2QWP6_9ACTN